jgi:iron(III) transport system ATP-binding protein
LSLTQREREDIDEGHSWGARGTAGAVIAAGLAFEGVSHTYGDLASVSGVDLSIRPGEIVCLLGRSGCGKSTLLRLAAGLETPTAGRILIDGVEMSSAKRVTPPERRGVGLMFQDFALFPHLTILENVTYGLSRLPRSDARSTALVALGRVGLVGHAADYPHQLSGGEQQRVALARAIAPKPGVLLMDEPFSGLDARLRDQVRDETLAVMRETRATCIVVTHDPEEAMRVADRVALMRAGRIVQLATPEELYRRPVDVLAARFFSELNEMEGVVRAGFAETPVGRVPTTLEEGARVDVCVRLQGVRVTPPGEGVPGRLLRRRFLGEVDLLEVAVAGLDRPLVARCRNGAELRVGRDVGVHLLHEDVLVFPRALV